MRCTLALPFLALFALALPEGQDPDAPAYASEVSRVLATYEARVVDSTPASRVAAAQGFLEGLSAARRKQATFPIDSPTRAQWTNVPPGADEPGVRLGDCTEEELQHACDLLRTVLSEQGYDKMRAVLLADDELLPEGRPRRGFGAENFWLSIYGEPHAERAWGLQLDGHHLALNLSFHGAWMSQSPSFWGAQPHAVEVAGERVEILKDEIDAAYALLATLTDAQREQAIVSNRRGANVAAAGKDGVIPEPQGVSLRPLQARERDRVIDLFRECVDNLPEEAVEVRLLQLAHEIGEMRFAWSGPTEPGGDMSFRLQGPTLILEFACQDLGGNPLDHLHLMVRDPSNEYGALFPKVEAVLKDR